MSKLPGLAVIAAVLAVGLSACGSSSSSSTGVANKPVTPGTSSTSAAPAAGGLALAADPSGQLKFDKSSLTAKAGKVTIVFTNSASLAHNVTIQKGTSGAVVGATPTFQGGTKTLTVTLKPGKYTFFCSVPGHRQGGMVGTLTVK
jgi:plastocyanin